MITKTKDVQGLKAQLQRLNETLKIEEEKRKKYNPDKIFKSDEKKEKIESKVAMTVYKESVFRKFINKIKNIFHVS